MAPAQNCWMDPIAERSNDLGEPDAGKPPVRFDEGRPQPSTLQKVERLDHLHSPTRRMQNFSVRTRHLGTKLLSFCWLTLATATVSATPPLSLEAALAAKRDVYGEAAMADRKSTRLNSS